MTEEIEKIREELASLGNKEIAEHSKRYLKSEYDFYGIRVPILRKIARNYKDIDLYSCYKLFDELWKSGNHQEMSLGIFILEQQKKKFNLETWKFIIQRLERAKSWDHIDGLSSAILGEILVNNLQLISEIKKMAESKNPWIRRVSIVSTYKLIKKNKLELTMRLAEKLVYDEDIYVQKGAGWMLRELGKKDRMLLREFILAHKDMKAFSLSYATEKMPELRKIIKDEKKVKKPVIEKIGAIIIKDRKILVCKKKNLWISPGGKIEKGETTLDCLKRELSEEIGVKVAGYKFLGKYEGDALLEKGMKVIIDFYLVDVMGEPKASAEIEEIKYIDSGFDKTNLGPGLCKFVIPELIKRGLID